eukprot:3753934-Amphidinium_carterae.1
MGFELRTTWSQLHRRLKTHYSYKVTATATEVTATATLGVAVTATWSPRARMRVTVSATACAVIGVALRKDLLSGAQRRLRRSVDSTLCNAVSRSTLRPKDSLRSSEPNPQNSYRLFAIYNYNYNFYFL